MARNKPLRIFDAKCKDVKSVPVQYDCLGVRVWFIQNVTMIVKFGFFERI